MLYSAVCKVRGHSRSHHIDGNNHSQNYRCVSEALVSDYPLSFYHAVAFRAHSRKRLALVTTTFSNFWMVAYESLDCIYSFVTVDRVIVALLGF